MTTINDVKILCFPAYVENDGALIPLECGKEIPFNVMRTFYVFDVPEGETRGFHAHKESEQVLVCLKGSCEIILRDGENVMTVHLDDPSRGVHVPIMIWNEIVYHSNDTLFLALASKNYDPDEYVSDWNKFVKAKYE